MDEKTQHLKSDVVASLRKLADDVEAGALLDADIELHNELKNQHYFGDPGTILDLPEAPDLRQHRNARISIRWADQMPEDQDAPAGLKTTGAGVGMSEETLEKLRQWPGDKGAEYSLRRARTLELSASLRRSSAAAIDQSTDTRNVIHNALVAISNWLEGEAQLQ